MCGDGKLREDIVASISPLLGAFGLLASDGSVDINNWTLEKALGVFGTMSELNHPQFALGLYLNPKNEHQKCRPVSSSRKGTFLPTRFRKMSGFPFPAEPVGK